MKKLFTLASIATLMFSCSENLSETPFEEKLPINISVGVQTRANDNSFDDGDAVGIYVVNYDGTTAGTLLTEGNQADNTKFTYNGSAWNSDETIYWKDKSTTTDFYAYYPYSASVDITAHQFDVKADQSNETNFWASDFLWGKTANVVPTSSAVTIQTNHSLSRIIVEVKPGSGFTSATWAAANKSVKICDVKTAATIDLATGVATATGDASEIIPFATTSNYKAMMVPQTVADDSKLIVVTVDGTEYVYRTGYTFKANTQHNFSITVNKGASSVNVTIGEWNIDSVINEGSAVEEVKNIIPTIPNNEIWYTTTDGNIVTSPTSGTFYNQKSNTYADGKGVIVFNSNVTSISSNQFKSLTKLESVVIPDSVTEIGISSFSGCSSLKSATLGSGLKYIDENAFSNCTALVEIYCKATTPPSVENQAALGGLYTANKKIYVPTSSVDAYKKAQNWASYSSMIVGYDFE
ncbi:MAG: fimbrillin family protein [Alistipes sp.]|nr:fimbrillin family protein [Alistipes sp.]